jgi:hypothetical protein
MATDKYDLHTIDYSVQGWDSILAADMEKLDEVIPSREIVLLGETVTAYKAACFKAADSKWYLARANGTLQPCHGLFLEGGDADDEVRIHRMGKITNAGWSWANLGDPIYLDPDTSGALTQTPPASNKQVIGYALSATSMLTVPLPQTINDGHIIQDESTPMTARENLKFAGAGVEVTDDEENEATLVTIPGGGDNFDPASPGAIGETTPGTIQGKNKEIYKTASADSPLTALQCSGTIVSNYGMTDADCIIDLPTAEEGLSFVCILPAVRARYFRLRCPSAQADKIYLLGVAGSDDGYVGVASGYATGAAISMFTFKASDGGFDWFAIPIFGTWVAG